MKLVYIAAPFASTPTRTNAQHVEDARQAAREVARAGAVPLCPHTMYAGMEDIRDAEWWYEATMDTLAVCDAMVRLPGWSESRGCIREIGYAGAAGIPVLNARGEDVRAAVELWLSCAS